MPQIMRAIFAAHAFIRVTNLLLYLCITSAIIHTLYIMCMHVCVCAYICIYVCKYVCVYM